MRGEREAEIDGEWGRISMGEGRERAGMVQVVCLILSICLHVKFGQKSPLEQD